MSIKKRLKTLFTFACLGILFQASALSKTPSIITQQEGYRALTTNRVKAHLRFISHDLLEGRLSTERGQKIAANYIASVFERIGLKPIGDSAQFFQPFSLSTIEKVSEPSISLISTLTGKTTYISQGFFSDFFFFPKCMPSFDTLRGKITLAQYDSSSNTFDIPTENLHENIVLILPKHKYQTDTILQKSISFCENSELTIPYRELKTAKAIFIPVDCFTEKSLQKYKQLINRQTYPSFLSLASPEKILPDSTDIIPPLYFISPNLAERILHPSIDSLISTDRLKNEVELVLINGFKAKSKKTENVLGLLEGADPNLKNEVVVLSAHYDHIGKLESGEVFNGADDNASGTSAVLSLAEAFALEPNRPKRSILFVNFSGEERGLLGSKYYANHPLIALSNTTANINMDMVGRVDKTHKEKNTPNYIYVIGSDILSRELDDLLKLANKETVGLKLDYTFNDIMDSNRYYYRSDHYSFAKHGIPAMLLFNGLHNDYHQTTDTFEKINIEKLTAIAKLVYALTWNLANLDHPLRLNDSKE